MTQDPSAAAAGSRSTVPTEGQRGTSGWVGWIAFAAMLLILLGVFHIVEGVVALAKDEYFVVGPSGLVLSIDYTAWGWIHLIGGAIVLAAGFGVFGGRVWARAVGVAVAMLSAVANMLFLAAYPLWSIVMITLAVVIIMALTVHGSEIRAE